MVVGNKFHILESWEGTFSISAIFYISKSKTYSQWLDSDNNDDV